MQTEVKHKESVWILASCQPHRVTSGWKQGRFILSTRNPNKWIFLATNQCMSETCTPLKSFKHAPFHLHHSVNTFAAFRDPWWRRGSCEVEFSVYPPGLPTTNKHTNKQWHRSCPPSEVCQFNNRSEQTTPVSYTHLTLPTSVYV